MKGLDNYDRHICTDQWCSGSELHTQINMKLIQSNVMLISILHRFLN